MVKLRLVIKARVLPVILMKMEGWFLKLSRCKFPF